MGSKHFGRLWSNQSSNGSFNWRGSSYWRLRRLPCLKRRQRSALEPFACFSPTSRSIGQTLAFDALDRKLGALDIVNSKLHPVRIAEVKFGEITVKGLFFAVLINAFHSTLEVAVITVDGIGRNQLSSLPAGVFILGVVDGVVASELSADLWIPSGLIGHDLGTGRHVGADDGLQFSNGGSADVKAASGPATF